MARKILGEYGPERTVSGNRAKCGGITEDKQDVMNYSPPMGPKNMYRPGPGLRGGTNLGNSGTQQGRNMTGDGAVGSPGLGGDSIRSNGSQGRR